MSTIKTLLRSVAVPAVVALAGLAPAYAETDDLRIDDAWRAALIDFEGVVDEKQHAMLNLIAYSAASARLCEGLDIDQAKVGKAVDEIIAPRGMKMNGDQQLTRMSRVLVMLGTFKGIFLAEGALHKDVFCKTALADKADPENKNFWK